MTRRFLMVLVALAATVTLASGVWACPDDDPACQDLKPDLKGFIRLACDPSDPGCDPNHHIDVRGLLKLACDRSDPDCENCKPDLKGLLQLACPIGVEDCFRKELGKLKQLACPTGVEDCFKKPLFNGLMQLACNPGNEGCDGFRRDLPGGSLRASAPKQKKLAFMGIPKSINRDSLERSVGTRSLQEKSVRPASFTASVGSVAPKPSREETALERIQKADPKDFPVLTAFLSKKIPVNSQDTYGNTLLFYMAARGDVSAVKYLLDKGADPKVKNTKGYTAADFARAKGHTAVVSLLTK